MKIYHYHPEYRHFLSEENADPSPLEPGKYLVPLHATSVEPPSCNEGEVQVFDGTSWSVVEDRRGIYYSTETLEQIINDNCLESPSNSTKEIPPEIAGNQYLTWDDGWVVNDPAPSPELTPEEKLANAGLTVEELRGLLGL